MLMRALLVHVAHVIAGAARIRHSLRPLTTRGRKNNLQTSGAMRRENADSHPRRRQRIEYKTQPRLCEERLRRSNPCRRKRRDGLLRGACHRARIRATRWLAMTWGGSRGSLRRRFGARMVLAAAGEQPQ